jgi:hypothetical protein
MTQNRLCKASGPSGGPRTTNHSHGQLPCYCYEYTLVVTFPPAAAAVKRASVRRRYKAWFWFTLPGD